MSNLMKLKKTDLVAMIEELQQANQNQAGIDPVVKEAFLELAVHMRRGMGTKKFYPLPSCKEAVRNWLLKPEIDNLAQKCEKCNGSGEYNGKYWCNDCLCGRIFLDEPGTMTSLDGLAKQKYEEYKAQQPAKRTRPWHQGQAPQEQGQKTVDTTNVPM
jgi:hypothetical protein